MSTEEHDTDATLPPTPSAPTSAPDQAVSPEPERAAEQSLSVARPRRVGVFAAAAVLALGLDIATKAAVVAKLPQTHRPVRTLDGLFYLQQTRNSGAAFSLGTGFTVILTIVALVVAAVIVRVAGRLHSTGWAIALGFILGGALGNLVDRFFREPGVGRGHVVDWISVFGPNGEHWPIFNIADSAIVGGAILAAVLTMFGVELSGRRQRQSR